MKTQVNQLRHFLRISDCTKEEILQIIDMGLRIKKEFLNGKQKPYLGKKILAMIFEKSSTRTRVSFEAGIYQLGGIGIFLSSKDIQLGRGEPIKDTARVVSSMVDMAMIRTDAHSRIEEFATYSLVPVINGLSDDFHPVQLLADYMTMVECGIFVPTKKKLAKFYPKHKANPIVAYIGDGNNIAHSWITLASLLGFELRIASPKEYEPKTHILQPALKMARDNGVKIHISQDIQSALKGANVVTTDTWTSMGQEEQKQKRANAFKQYCIDNAKMSLAQKEAIFLHCLPAYRGQEVSEEVLEGTQSKVFEEAQNRLHAQKGLMVWLSEKNKGKR